MFVELHRKSALLAQQSSRWSGSNSELQDAIQRSWRAEEEIKALNRHLERRVGELNDVNRELEAFSYSVRTICAARSAAFPGSVKRCSNFTIGQLDDQGRLFLNRIDTPRGACAIWWKTCSELLPPDARGNDAGRRSISARCPPLAAELRSREPEREVEFMIEDGVQAWGDPDLVARGDDEPAGELLEVHAQARDGTH